MRWSHGAVRPVVAVLFLCSGASGLIFETLWMRLLTTVFGSTTYALSTLLTVYMGGLALGGWLAGRWADGLEQERHVLIAYGALELVVGSYGLLFPAILGQVDSLNAWVWQSWRPGPYAFALIRFGIVGIVLLLPTTALGATLPVLGRFYARQPSGIGRDVGTLYSINVLGAVGGTFLGGFVLMPRLGLGATNRVACSINLSLCVAAVGLGALLHRRREDDTAVLGTGQDAPARAPAPPPSAAADLSGARDLRIGRRVALGAIAFSGVLAMGYQQVWTRVLSLVIGSSVYAFALILMAFLLGLALGGAVYARRTAGRSGQMDNLGVVHLLVAAMAAGGLLYMDRLPDLFRRMASAGTITPGTVFLMKFGVCALLVLLPTAFLGMVFPATLAALSGSGRGVGRTVGTVYAINTLGAIVGSFLGGFVLLPLLGAQCGLAALISGNLLLGLVFFGVADLGRGARMGRVAMAGLVGTILGVGVISRWDPEAMTAGVFRLDQYLWRSSRAACGRVDDPVERFFLQGGGQGTLRYAARRLGFRPRLDPLCALTGYSRILEYREGVVATVSTRQAIFPGLTSEICWEHLVLQVNGKADASATGAFRRPLAGRCRDLLGAPWRITPEHVSLEGDMETEVLSGVIGVLVHPRAAQVRRAMVIGWGSGISVGALAQIPGIHVDAVELEPEVIRAARAFERYAWDAEHAPNVRILLADGRNVLLGMPAGYDVVVSEPSNPWMTGAASLFTREFFLRVRSRLRPDGIFVQWLQIYEISQANVRTLLATLRSVFPYVRVVQPQRATADLLLLAARHPIPLRVSQLRRRLRAPGMAPVLHRIAIRSVGDLLSRFLLAPEDVDRLTRGAPLNTDDNARIEFATPLDLINFRLHSSRQILAWMRAGSRPASEQVEAPTDAVRLEVVDALLRLGRLARARATLQRVSPGRARRLRGAVLTWLSAPPPADDSWVARRSPAATALRGTEFLRLLGRRARTPEALVRLAWALSRSGRPRLALLFSSAGLVGRWPSLAEARLRVDLLRRLGRWGEAARIARAALTARKETGRAGQGAE